MMQEILAGKHGQRVFYQRIVRPIKINYRRNETRTQNAIVLGIFQGVWTVFWLHACRLFTDIKYHALPSVVIRETLDRWARAGREKLLGSWSPGEKLENDIGYAWNEAVTDMANSAFPNACALLSSFTFNVFCNIGHNYVPDWRKELYSNILLNSFYGILGFIGATSAAGLVAGLRALLIPSTLRYDISPLWNWLVCKPIDLIYLVAKVWFVGPAITDSLIGIFRKPTIVPINNNNNNNNNNRQPPTSQTTFIPPVPRGRVGERTSDNESDSSTSGDEFITTNL